MNTYILLNIITGMNECWFSKKKNLESISWWCIFVFSWFINLVNYFSCFYIVMCLVAQSCSTLCDPLDCRLPGSSVHGILQARILEWAAVPSDRGSSQSGDQTQVSYIVGRFFTSWVTKKAQLWGAFILGNFIFNCGISFL